MRRALSNTMNSENHMKYQRTFPHFLAFGTMALAFLASSSVANAQRGESQLDSSPPQGITEQEIIQRFAAKEKEFKQAREQYAYRQSLTVQNIDGRTVNGELKEVEDVLFDDKRNRVEHVVFAPGSTLQGILMTKEDY